MLNLKHPISLFNNLLAFPIVDAFVYLFVFFFFIIFLKTKFANNSQITGVISPKKKKIMY